MNIAKVCHEANRAYCESIGDNSQLSWEDALFKAIVMALS